MKRLLTHDLAPSLLVIAVITVAYCWVARGGIPAPGTLFGHSLGIVGFLLMLGAETLYTLRKSVRAFNRGSMAAWLRAHIFMGMVGGYLTLLHSAGKLHGLAGVLAGLTLVIMLSGLLGRFIYTAVPRTLEGTEISVSELLARCSEAERLLNALEVFRLEDLPGAEPEFSGWLSVLGRRLLKRRYHRRVRRALRNLPACHRGRAAEIQRLLDTRYDLYLKLQSLAATRRLFALWHVFHVPLSIVLFTLAFIHIGAVIYYSRWWR